MEYPELLANKNLYPDVVVGYKAIEHKVSSHEPVITFIHPNEKATAYQKKNQRNGNQSSVSHVCTLLYL